MAQNVKNLPAMQKTQVRSPGWKDALEKKLATHTSVLAWRMDRGAWQSIVYGVTKRGIQLSNSHGLAVGTGENVFPATIDGKCSSIIH